MRNVPSLNSYSLKAIVLDMWCLTDCPRAKAVRRSKVYLIKHLCYTLSGVSYVSIEAGTWCRWKGILHMLKVTLSFIIIISCFLGLSNGTVTKTLDFSELWLKLSLKALTPWAGSTSLLGILVWPDLHQAGPSAFCIKGQPHDILTSLDYGDELENEHAAITGPFNTFSVSEESILFLRVTWHNLGWGGITADTP